MLIMHLGNDLFIYCGVATLVSLSQRHRRKYLALSWRPSWMGFSLPWMPDDKCPSWFSLQQPKWQQFYPSGMMPVVHTHLLVSQELFSKGKNTAILFNSEFGVMSLHVIDYLCGCYELKLSWKSQFSVLNWELLAICIDEILKLLRSCSISVCPVPAGVQNYFCTSHVFCYLSLFQVTTVIIWIILLLLFRVCVFTYYQSLLLSKVNMWFFNVTEHLSS